MPEQTASRAKPSEVAPAASQNTAEPATPASDAPIAECKARMLPDEPLLSRSAITLSMGYSAGEANLRFPRACKPPKLESFFALTARGMEPLSVDPTNAEVNVPWDCGERDPAFRMMGQRAFERGNVPVAIGSNAALALQWVPATRIEGSADCPPPEPGAKLEPGIGTTLFQFAGDELRWSIEYWSPAPRVTEATDLKAITRIVVLNRVAADGTCEGQDRVEAGDFGPLQDNQGEYQRIYGWLTAKDDTEEKSWMIFAAGGGESDGVATVPFDPKTLQLQPQGVYFRRYDGC